MKVLAIQLSVLTDESQPFSKYLVLVFLLNLRHLVLSELFELGHCMLCNDSSHASSL